MAAAITVPGARPVFFEITCANLGQIGMPQGAVVAIKPFPPPLGSAALAQKAGRSILGILVSRSPDLLFQPGQIVQLDASWNLAAVEVVPVGSYLPA